MNIQHGINAARHAAITQQAGQPHRVEFASLEKRVCAAIQGTRYDVLCWHMSSPACHWVNGAIACMYPNRIASDFGQPYTPIRWRE